MIAGLDLLIIVAYLVVVLGVGFFLGKGEKTEGFFVNNRKTGLFLLIFTTLSTQVGAGTVIGLSSAAYTSGISLGLTYLILVLGGWLFMAWLAPRIKAWADQTQAYTLGDYFNSRYSKATRRVGTVVILCSYFLITAVQFVAFAKLAEVTVGVNFKLALIITAFITILYTIFAGIRGDFYTDAIQFFVMLPVFSFLFIAAFRQTSLVEVFSGLSPEMFNPFNYAGPAFFIAALAFGIPIIAVSMEVWQRVFAASSSRVARKAFIYSGVLNALLIAASIIIGFIALKLVPGVDGDSAMFELMKSLLPAGILGLGFASVLAILMSSIDSMLMVGSATLTKDFYLVRYPETSEKRTLFMGRFFVFIFGVIALVVAMFFQDIVKLIVVSSQVLGVFMPALIGGLLWKRSTAPAAFWSILIGFVTTVGLLYFMPDTAFIPGLILAIVIFVVMSLKGEKMPDKVSLSP